MGLAIAYAGRVGKAIDETDAPAYNSSMKTHLAITRFDRRTGENRTWSLCGRSSFAVWGAETVEPGQNVGTEQKVTCKLCLSRMEKRKQAA